MGKTGLKPGCLSSSVKGYHAGKMLPHCRVVLSFFPVCGMIIVYLLQGENMLKPKPTVGTPPGSSMTAFGLFIHWGLYALPSATSGCSHARKSHRMPIMRHISNISTPPYTTRAPGQKPPALPDEVRRPHRQAPRRFLLWDSQYTDYKVTNTPMVETYWRPTWKPSAPKGCAWAFTTRCWIAPPRLYD